MGKITLARKADTHLFTAILQTGEKQERYDCELTFCSNPTCTCATVEVTLLPAGDSAHAGKEVGRNFFFRLDFVKKAIDLDGGELEGQNQNYARLFARELGEEGWELLSREYVEYKQHITEIADLSTIDTHFPAWEIDNEGMMIEYREILPFGMQIVFPIENDHIHVLDQHCVKVGCKCANVALAFVSASRKASGKNRALEGVFFDWRTKKWNFTKADGNIGISEEVLVATLKRAYPNIDDLLKARHDTLGKLYRQYKARSHTGILSLRRHRGGSEEIRPARAAAARNTRDAAEIRALIERSLQRRGDR